MNETPETDAQLTNFLSISKLGKHFTNRTGTVNAEFARTLERERDEAREESKRLEQLCANVHDRLLRGDDDEELLTMLSEAWAKAARHKEAAK
jgi:transposase-like protein